MTYEFYISIYKLNKKRACEYSKFLHGFNSLKNI